MLRAVTFALLLMWPIGVAQAQKDTGRLSETTALSLSLFGTLGAATVGFLWWQMEQQSSPTGAVLIAGAAIVGPSFGHFYAGRTGGVWVRLGVGVGAPLLARAVLGSGSSGADGCLGCFLPDLNLGAVIAAGVILAAGGAAIVVSAVHDIGTAPRAARERNESRSAARVRILPSYAPSTHAVGLKVRVTF